MLIQILLSLQAMAADRDSVVGCVTGIEEVRDGLSLVAACRFEDDAAGGRVGEQRFELLVSGVID
jgi:hypothetical protein